MNEEIEKEIQFWWGLLVFICFWFLPIVIFEAENCRKDKKNNHHG